MNLWYSTGFGSLPCLKPHWDRVLNSSPALSFPIVFHSRFYSIHSYKTQVCLFYAHCLLSYFHAFTFYPPEVLCQTLFSDSWRHRSLLYFCNCIHPFCAFTQRNYNLTTLKQKQMQWNSLQSEPGYLYKYITVLHSIIWYLWHLLYNLK